MAIALIYIALIYAHLSNSVYYLLLYLGFVEESKKISFAALSILKEKLEPTDHRIG